MTNPFEHEKKLTTFIILVAGLGVLISYLLGSILLPFIAAFVIAYTLNPLIETLAKYQISRPYGAFIILFVFVLFFAGVLFVSIPLLKRELFKLASMLPTYGHKLFIFIEPYAQKLLSNSQIVDFATLADKFVSNIGDILSYALKFIVKLFTNSMAIANLLSLIIISPIIAFYLLRDWPQVTNTMSDLIPPQSRSRFKTLINDINKTLGGYFRGQATVCLCLALFYAITLSLIGLDYAITIGLITGLFAFIPYLGFSLGFIAAIAVAIAQFSSWIPISLVSGVYLIGQILESYVLTPKLVGKKIGLHPVWVIFALLAGGVLAGFWGLLIAMPVAALIGVFIRFFISYYRKTDYYSPTPQKQVQRTTEPSKEKTPAKKDDTKKQ